MTLPLEPFVTAPAKSALMEAYFEKRTLLVRYFTRLLGDANWAEDLVQDLYVRLSAMPEVPEAADPAAFLFRMGHNLYLNQLRARLSGRAREAAWQSLSAGSGGEVAVDVSPSPEDQAHGRQQMRLFQAALDSLPEKTRVIFRLHRIDGIPQAEVAARLGISLSSVEKHLSAALKALTARLWPGARAGPE